MEEVGSVKSSSSWVTSDEECADQLAANRGGSQAAQSPADGAATSSPRRSSRPRRPSGRWLDRDTPLRRLKGERSTPIKPRLELTRRAKPQIRIVPGSERLTETVTNLPEALAYFRPSMYERHPELAQEVNRRFRQKLAQVDRITMSQVTDKFRYFNKTAFQTGVLTHDANPESKDLLIPLDEAELDQSQVPVDQKMHNLLEVLRSLPQRLPPLPDYPNCGSNRPNHFVPVGSLITASEKSKCMPALLVETEESDSHQAPPLANLSLNSVRNELEGMCMNGNSFSYASLFDENANYGGFEIMSESGKTPEKLAAAGGREPNSPQNPCNLSSGSKSSRVRKLRLVIDRTEVEKYREVINQSPVGSVVLSPGSDSSPNVMDQPQEDQDPIEASSLNQGREPPENLEVTIQLFQPSIVSSPIAHAANRTQLSEASSKGEQCTLALGASAKSQSGSDKSQKPATNTPSARRKRRSPSSRKGATLKQSQKRESNSSPKQCDDLKLATLGRKSFQLSESSYSEESPIKRNTQTNNKTPTVSSYKIPKKSSQPQVSPTRSDLLKPGLARQIREVDIMDRLFGAEKRAQPKPKRRKPPSKPSRAVKKSLPQPIVFSPDGSLADPSAKDPASRSTVTVTEVQEESVVIKPSPVKVHMPGGSMDLSLTTKVADERKKLSLSDYKMKRTKSQPASEPPMEDGEVPDSDEDISIVNIVQDPESVSRKRKKTSRRSSHALAKSSRRKAKAPQSISLSGGSSPSENSTSTSSSDKLCIDENMASASERRPTPPMAETPDTLMDPSPPKGGTTRYESPTHEALFPSQVAERGPGRKKIASEAAGDTSQAGGEGGEDEVQLELDSVDRMEWEESEGEEELPVQTRRVKPPSKPSLPTLSGTELKEAQSNQLTGIEATAPPKMSFQESVEAIPAHLRLLFDPLFSRRLCFRRLEFGSCCKENDSCRQNHVADFADFLTFLRLIGEASTESQLPLLLQHRGQTRLHRVMGIYNSNKSSFDWSQFLEVAGIVVETVAMAASTTEVDIGFEFSVILSTIVRDLRYFDRFFMGPTKVPLPVVLAAAPTITKLHNDIIRMSSQLEGSRRTSNEMIKVSEALSEVLAQSSAWGLPLNLDSYQVLFRLFTKFDSIFPRSLNVLFYFAFLPGFTVPLEDLDLFIRKFSNDLGGSAICEALCPILLNLPQATFQSFLVRYPSLKILIRRCLEPAHQVACASLFDRIRLYGQEALFPLPADVEGFQDTTSMDKMTRLIRDPTQRHTLLDIMETRALNGLQQVSPHNLRSFFLDLTTLLLELEELNEVDLVFTEFVELFFKTAPRPPIFLEYLAQTRNTLLVHIHRTGLVLDARARSGISLNLIPVLDPLRPRLDIWRVAPFHDPSALAYDCLTQKVESVDVLKAAISLLAWKRHDRKALALFATEAKEVVLEAAKHERVDLARSILRLQMDVHKTASKPETLECLVALFQDHIAPWARDKRVDASKVVADFNLLTQFCLSHCQTGGAPGRDFLERRLLPLLRQFTFSMTFWEATARALVHTLELHGLRSEANHFHAKARDLDHYPTQSSLDLRFSVPCYVSPQELAVVLRCFLACLVEENVDFDRNALQSVLSRPSLTQVDLTSFRIAVEYESLGSRTTGLTFLDNHRNDTPEIGRRRFMASLEALSPPIRTDQNGESLSPLSLIQHLVTLGSPADGVHR